MKGLFSLMILMMLSGCMAQGPDAVPPYLKNFVKYQKVNHGSGNF